MNIQFIHSSSSSRSAAIYLSIMSILQKLFLFTIPFSTILTTIAMLIPYWWTSDTLQIGLWRARTLTTQWIDVEPQIDTSEGRLLFVLQVFSLASVIFTDTSALIWLYSLIRRTSYQSLASLISLLCLTILAYFTLSILIFFVWHSTQMHVVSIHLSYSFYLTVFLLISHTITLISLTINLSRYRMDHHTIQPCLAPSKVVYAFNNEPLV